MDDFEQVEQAFLQRILASPLDRLSRLVYADWLDERGDERAEFLRLQCQVVAGLERLTELSESVPQGWAGQVNLLSQALLIFRLPGLGEGVRRASVRSCPVQPGQRLGAGSTLVEVESGNARYGIPTHYTCVVLALLVGPGESVPVGSPLALLLRV